MKKEYRVKKSQEFAEIMNYKKFYTCPSFAIYVKPRKEDHARVGISAVSYTHLDVYKRQIRKLTGQ